MQVSINLVQLIKPTCSVSFEMPQGTFMAAMAHGFQRDQCPVGQKLKRPSKVFLLGVLRVRTPIVGLMNQVPFFQQKKKYKGRFCRMLISFLDKGLQVCGFLSLTSTDKCCCRRKRKRVVRLQKICYFVKWANLQKWSNIK